MPMNYNNAPMGANPFGPQQPQPPNQGSFYANPINNGQGQMPPYAATSQPQPQQGPLPVFPGRYISELSEVRPNEVPMDGSIALFPNKDLSEIYLKSWRSDGRILNFRYVLDTSVDLNAQAEPPQQDYQDLASRLANLEAQVKKTSARGKTKPEEEVSK